MVKLILVIIFARITIAMRRERIAIITIVAIISTIIVLINYFNYATVIDIPWNTAVSH